jgi:hypothetical protein
MAGLSLGVYGGAKSVGSGSGFSSSAPTGGTATEQAFGPGYTQQGGTGVVGSLFSSGPARFNVVAAIASTFFLLFVRHSLPA